MGHFFCLRSQNRLLAELADLFTIPQPGEGIDGRAIPMLFLLLRQGKVIVDFICCSNISPLDTRGWYSEIFLCFST